MNSSIFKISKCTKDYYIPFRQETIILFNNFVKSSKYPGPGQVDQSEKQFPTFLAPGTVFVEESGGVGAQEAELRWAAIF